MLVLYRTRADCNVREQVGEETVILRIEHFVRTGEAGLVDGPHMELAYGDEALEHI